MDTVSQGTDTVSQETIDSVSQGIDTVLPQKTMDGVSRYGYCVTKNYGWCLKVWIDTMDTVSQETINCVTRYGYCVTRNYRQCQKVWILCHKKL